MGATGLLLGGTAITGLLSRILAGLLNPRSTGGGRRGPIPLGPRRGILCETGLPHALLTPRIDPCLERKSPRATIFPLLL